MQMILSGCYCSQDTRDRHWTKIQSFQKVKVTELFSFTPLLDKKKALLLARSHLTLVHLHIFQKNISEQICSSTVIDENHPSMQAIKTNKPNTTTDTLTFKPTNRN
jgi:hypothetical protein